MEKTKLEIVKSVLSGFRPEPYVKRIKVGFRTHDDGKTILIVQFDIDREKLDGRNLNKENVMSWTTEIATKIRNFGKIPIGYTETQVKYI